MKFNKWTAGLAALGVVSLASAAYADEQMSQVQTALSQTTLSGYVDTAMQWSPGTDQSAGSAGVANKPTYSFAKNDGFSLNAVDIALDKPEDSSAWAAGYHVELMFGANSEPGINFTGNATAANSGFGSIRQAFIRLHTPVGGNGIDWQIGVFDSIIGYESNSDPLNPNYTRSYGYTIEPTTFTGILGTYKVNDSLSFSAGVANMWNDNFAQVGYGVKAYQGLNTTAFEESQKAYMGAINLTAPDSAGFLKGATVTLGVVHGVNSTIAGGSETSWYAGATLPTPVNVLKVGAAFDYLMEAQQSAVITPAGPIVPGTITRTGVTGGDDIWTLGLYATIQATDKLSLNVRGEYFDDGSHAFAYNSGTTGAPIPTLTSFDAVALYPGNKGEEFTATVQYNLWANVMTRGEFRWDHVEHTFGNLEGFGANQSTGAIDKSNDFLLALNVIYQF